MRVHGIELTGLDEGRDDRPVGAALITAGEQGIFSTQRNRPDGALDDVGVDLDAAIVEEPAGRTSERTYRDLGCAPDRRTLRDRTQDQRQEAGRALRLTAGTHEAVDGRA